MEILIEHMAKAGYERHFEDSWDNVREFNIEGDLWRDIAREMLSTVKKHGHYKE